MTWIIFSIAFFVFSGSIWLRHSWFQTSSWDLGIFDQATYLISQGLIPNSSLLNFHILGDHAHGGDDHHHYYDHHHDHHH